MANEPLVVAYVNRNVHALAEKIRALDVECNAAITEWHNGVSALVPNKPDIADSTRASEGVATLTGADITNFVTLLTNLVAVMRAEGVPQVISKPCVRELRVQQ